MIAIELAWVAGLFDSEGSIFASTSKQRPRYVKITMAMTDREPVDRFCQSLKIGKVIELKRKTVTGRTAYRWVIQGTEDVRKAVDKLRPYLSSPKMAQAEAALEKRNIYESQYKSENYRIAAKERAEARQ